ncbi:MAG: hypothetical protein CL912_09895 [Deltaproteobacteria bacterium]|nr:hypothetical protein [Deltaproteobacteria bacterium]
MLKLGPTDQDVNLDVDSLPRVSALEDMITGLNGWASRSVERKRASSAWLSDFPPQVIPRRSLYSACIKFCMKDPCFFC